MTYVGTHRMRPHKTSFVHADTRGVSLHHFLVSEIDIERDGDHRHESHDAPESPGLLLEG